MRRLFNNLQKYGGEKKVFSALISLPVVQNVCDLMIVM